MEEYKVSEVPCQQWCDGYRCPREKRDGGCPFVHNANDRRDAIAARRAAREKAEKAKKLAAEQTKHQAQRVKQQKEYDQLKVIKNNKVVHTPPKISNTPKAIQTVNSGVITPPASNAGDVAFNEDATQKTTLPLSPPPTPVHATVVTVAPTTQADDTFHTTNDPITKVPAAGVATVANGATPGTRVHNSDANVRIANSPVTDVPTVVNGVWQTQYTTSKQPCKKYLTRRGCPYPNCRYVHDMNARREYIAGLNKAAAERKALNLTSKKVVPAPQANVDTSSSKPKAGATYASTAAKSMVIASKVVISTPPATPPKASFWGTQTGLAIWAKNNLLNRSQRQLLMPYASIDQVPAEVMEKVRNPNKPVDGRVFQLFPALPGELRNQIWGYAIDDALLEGRRVKIQLHADVDFDRITTRNGPPSLMHACMESRSLAKLAYEQAFCHPEFFRCYWVPFNFEHDLLYIHTRGAMELCKLVNLMGKQNCARVKHVMVSLKEYLGDRSSDKNYWGRYMSYFPNLKSLKLVVGIGHEDERFHKKSYCQGATFALKEHLLKRYGKTIDKAQPSPADKAPKVDFEFIHAITAHELSIDNLIYQGEGGWGAEKRG